MPFSYVLCRIYLVLALLSFTSCIKELSLEPDFRNGKPVINALFTEGQKMKLYLRSTRGILEETAPPITNAFIILELMGEATLFDTLRYKGDYLYEGSQE